MTADRPTLNAEEIVRLECLKQAVTAIGFDGSDHVLGLARSFASFVLGDDAKND